MKRLSVILVSFLLYLPLCAQFKGTVSVDTNQSGIVDKGDKPLAGVMVTDGLNVVKTDKKGRFSLPGFEKTRFISITTILPFYQREQKKLRFYLNRKRADKTQKTFFRANHRHRSNGWNGALGNRSPAIH